MIPPGTADLHETVPYTVDTQMVFSPLAKEEARFAAVETGLMDGNPSSSHADGSEGEALRKSVAVSELHMELSPTPVHCLHPKNSM